MISQKDNEEGKLFVGGKYIDFIEFFNIFLERFTFFYCVWRLLNNIKKRKKNLTHKTYKYSKQKAKNKKYLFVLNSTFDSISTI